MTELCSTPERRKSAGMILCFASLRTSCKTCQYLRMKMRPILLFFSNPTRNKKSSHASFSERNEPFEYCLTALQYANFFHQRARESPLYVFVSLPNGLFLVIIVRSHSRIICFDYSPSLPVKVRSTLLLLLPSSTFCFSWRRRRRRSPETTQLDRKGTAGRQTHRGSSLLWHRSVRTHLPDSGSTPSSHYHGAPSVLWEFSLPGSSEEG